MARWPVTMVGEERREVEVEEHAHHMPRCMSGRHGGAVPARPARGYPGESSPRHHREHRTRRFHWRCTHTWTTANTHNKNREEIRWGVSSEATGVGENPSGARPQISSERRGFPNPLGGGGRGPRGASYAQVSVAEVTGDGRDLQATAAATLVAGGGSGEGERIVSEERVGWVGLTDPDPSPSG
jgi:hypothetical protein